jgi:hypothetical protein
VEEQVGGESEDQRNGGRQWRQGKKKKLGGRREWREKRGENRG